MAGERATELPEELDAWLGRRTAERETSRDEELAHALRLYQFLVDRAAESPPEGDPVERVEGLDERVDALESDLDGHVADLRERVIEVLRAVQSKAPADHAHDDLRERLDELAAERGTEDGDGTSSAALRADLEDLERTVDGGFENYERVLESLSDRTDDLRGKTNTLAGAVADLRARVADVEETQAERTAAADLAAAANRHGIAVADCEGCGSNVRLGLLAAPECPHCGCRFGGVEPARRFFGTARLTLDDRPALDGETDASFEGVDDESAEATTVEATGGARHVGTDGGTDEGTE